MQNAMFSIVGGLLSTIFIAVATYAVTSQPVAVRQASDQPTLERPSSVLVASHPTKQTTLRE